MVRIEEFIAGKISRGILYLLSALKACIIDLEQSLKIAPDPGYVAVINKIEPLKVFKICPYPVMNKAYGDKGSKYKKVGNP